MSQDIVSTRYAKALFQLGIQQNRLDAISKDMHTLQEVMMTSPQLREWFYHPATENEDKKKVISELLQDLTAVSKHFIYVVIDHSRERLLLDILSQYYRMVHEEKGEVEAQIFSAFPLSQDDQQQLIQTFNQMLGKQMIIKATAVNSDLLGGVIVRIGDRIYDGSLRTKLTRFQERLKRVNSQ